MRSLTLIGWLTITFFSHSKKLFSQTPEFKVLAFYATTVEKDHVDFAGDALHFFAHLASKDRFTIDSTVEWDKLNEETLKNYQLVIWVNEFPHTEAQRRAFEHYMEHGGAWLGFHVAGYNDKDTNWPWLVDFLGGAVFYTNSWPPLAARLVVDDRNHPVTRRLPARFISPINEWYLWKPSPRLNKNVKVLVTLDSANYPLGKKDIIKNGDLPVVWTNTQFKMVYMNMGHGDQVLTDSFQNNMIEDAILWLGRKK
ncbi:MAG: ThuA domain-containing protein [Bacteroidetes bacterium]|nr:MAG: ThuA domain-containing protein [Bacteroidota bacterium]